MPSSKRRVKRSAVPAVFKAPIRIVTVSGWRRMFIGNAQQFDERDEYMYHQPLAWCPLWLSGSPARVLILGGGDLCLARELHEVPAVHRIDVVDGHPDIFYVAKLHLGRINKRVYRSPKVHLWNRDARDLFGALGRDLFAEDERKFGVVLVDLTYPDDEPTAGFFARPFLEALLDLVEPQAGLGFNFVGPEWSPRTTGGLMATLADLRYTSILYTMGTPSAYEVGSGRCGFVFAGRDPMPEARLRRELRAQEARGSTLWGIDLDRGLAVPQAWVPLYLNAAPFASGREVLRRIAQDRAGALLPWIGPWAPYLVREATTVFDAEGRVSRR